MYFLENLGFFKINQLAYNFPTVLGFPKIWDQRAESIVCNSQYKGYITKIFGISVVVCSSDGDKVNLLFNDHARKMQVLMLSRSSLY